jgi:hypothetical protein
MLFEEHLNESDLLAFVNAGQLMLSLIAFLILALYVDSQLTSWKDLINRTRKSFSFDFQGGGYDWAVAVMVIFFGNVVRGETAWEYRTLGVDLRLWQSIIGIMISLLGLLCLVRVMVPRPWFPACWIATLFITLAFCFGSMMFSV